MKRAVFQKYFILIGAVTLLGSTIFIHCSQDTSRPTIKAQYTGIQSCQGCHEKIYNDFVQTGMGRSLYHPDTSQIIEHFGSQYIVYDHYKDFYYYPFWIGSKMFVKEYRLNGADTVFQRTELVDFVVGSGNQTRSYLMQRNGYLYEFPITWYVEKQIWDLSPGYEGGNNSRFDREIGTECLHCHTAQYKYVEGSKHKYEHITLGIDCERCHGPGGIHITSKGKGQIINPEDLSMERQFDVCQQCHLQGINIPKPNKHLADFRPGMELSEVYEVFLPQDSNRADFGIASHAARLRESQCFIQSAGELNCTTCHDPHQSLHQFDKNLYVQQCQECHQAGKKIMCSAPQTIQMQENGNCVSCHMPAGGTSDIPHVRFHDHKISVVVQDTEVDTGKVSEQLAFIKLLCATNEAATQKDWAAAWLRYYEQTNHDPIYLQEFQKYIDHSDHAHQASFHYYTGNYQSALSEINLALKNNPKDLDLLGRKGEILEALGQFSQAYSLYIDLYHYQPENIDAGLRRVNNLLKSQPGKQEVLIKAEQLLTQLNTKKSLDVRILSNLGFVLLNQQRLHEAEAYLVQALNLDPDHLTSLENMCYLQLKKGNRQQASTYFLRLKEKYPGSETVKRLEKML